MTEQNHNEQAAQEDQPKKITLEEAIKRKLAEKKQEQYNQKNAPKNTTDTKRLKSQNTKKPNNQRRRTGGS